MTLFRLVPTALAMLLLAACAGSGPAHAPRYYVLTPVAEPPEQVAGQRPVTVEVVSLRLPQYLERPQIVTRSASNRLVLNDWDQWGGNLRKDMALVFARNLSLLLDTPEVTVAPFSAAGSPDVRIALEVMRFERGPEGHVHLAAQWRLTGPSGEPLQTRFTDLVSDTAYGPSDFDGTVGAMSVLLADLSRVIADSIRAHLPHRGSPPA